MQPRSGLSTPPRQDNRSKPSAPVFASAAQTVRNHRASGWAGVCLAVLLLIALPRSSNAESPMKIRLLIGETTLSATLDDSPTGRDFWSLLPLTLSLRDYNRAEKISSLPRRLSTTGAPEGYKPVKGDLVLFVPWGNLAVFYKDASWYPGLVRIGHSTSDMEALATAADDTIMTVEKVAP